MPEATLNPPSAPCPECGQIVPAEPAVHGGGLITHCPRHGRIRLDPRRPPPPAAPTPPPSPTAVALETVADQMVKCPQCGRPAEVKALKDHHGEGPNAEPIVSAPWWLEIACERCGRKLHRAATPVEPIGPPAESVAIPAEVPSGVVPIGRAIGQMVECPDCHQPAIVATAQGTGARREANQAYVLAECRLGKKLWPAATPVRVLTPEERPAEVPSATPAYARGAIPR